MENKKTLRDNKRIFCAKVCEVYNRPDTIDRFYLCYSDCMKSDKRPIKNYDFLLKYFY